MCGWIGDAKEQVPPAFETERDVKTLHVDLIFEIKKMSESMLRISISSPSFYHI